MTGSRPVPISEMEASYLMGHRRLGVNVMERRARRAVFISFIIILLMSSLNILIGMRYLHEPERGADLGIYDTAPAAGTEAPVKPEVAATAEPQGSVSEHPAITGAQIHTVIWGDTFYSLTIKYWNERWFWPLMYYNNRSGFPDPDLLFPGQQVSIAPSPGMLESMDANSLTLLTEAYLFTYHRYRELAAVEKGDQSLKRLRTIRWLLYSAARINPAFPKTFQDEIDPADLAILRADLAKYPVN